MSHPAGGQLNEWLIHAAGLRHKLFSFASFSGFFESGPYWQIACHGS
jgi:hypothetical protein